MNTFEPNTEGIFDIPASTYHKAPGVSNSLLGHLDPPARLPAYFEEEDDETTLAMRMGTLIHAQMLEPHLPLPRIAIVPEKYGPENKPWNFNANECKDWKKRQLEAGLFPMKRDAYDRTLACVKAISQDPDCREIFADGQSEVSVFWSFLPEGDPCSQLVPCKSRIDWIPKHGNALVDIKKVTKGKGSASAFGKLMIDRRYHVQAAYYLAAWNYHMAATDRRDSFVFVVVEDEAPFLVNRLYVPDAILEMGRKQFEKDLATYAECKSTNRWPGYPSGINEIQVPPYLIK